MVCCLALLLSPERAPLFFFARMQVHDRDDPAVEHVERHCSSDFIARVRLLSLLFSLAPC